MTETRISKIKDDDLLEIIYSPSVKCNDRKGYIPDIICCHQTGGSLSVFRDAVLDASKVYSAHFAVSRCGEVYAFADIEKMVFANPTDISNKLNINHYSRAINPIVRSRNVNADLYTISVFFENSRSGVLTYSQYDAGLRLFIYIIDRLKNLYGYDFVVDRNHFVGHYEISPAVAMNCPGIDFPFSCFIRDLKE